MPNERQHSTRLDTDVTAFAFEPTADYYLEFSSTPTVHNRMLYLSNVRKQLHHASAYSCIFALFRNSAEHIRDLCSFVLLPHSLAPSVLAFDAATVLFTNTTNVTHRCPGKPAKVLRDCKQCIRKLPCGCAYSTPATYVPPHLENCHLPIQNETAAPETHVTNLAVLSHFFSQADLGQLAADT